MNINLNVILIEINRHFCPKLGKNLRQNWAFRGNKSFTKKLVEIFDKMRVVFQCEFKQTKIRSKYTKCTNFTLRNSRFNKGGGRGGNGGNLGKGPGLVLFVLGLVWNPLLFKVGGKGKGGRLLKSLFSISSLLSSFLGWIVSVSTSSRSSSSSSSSGKSTSSSMCSKMSSISSSMGNAGVVCSSSLIMSAWRFLESVSWSALIGLLLLVSTSSNELLKRHFPEILNLMQCKLCKHRVVS